MIYLSKLILNPASRMVQSELRDPYQMHRTLMRGFNGNRELANVLYRLDVNPLSGNLVLLVQSTEEPNWQPLTQIGRGEYLLAPTVYKPVYLSLQNGQVFRFRLVANPSVKRGGKRHALYKEKDQRHWLETKGTGSPEKNRPASGFQVLDVDVQPQGNRHGRIRLSEHEKHYITFYPVLFEGTLQVTNSKKFTRALRTGIGPAKAFGCGLLSLAPAG